MKKAFKINLGGQIFHIDDDAYEKLKNYLDSISGHFSDADESREIISDIENRIAEHFINKMKTGIQVISIKDVDEVMIFMGRPEEIAGDENEGEKRKAQRRSYRRLYRDPENAVFGGVCSGLGAYFNIDSVIIRILFILLLFVGWGLLIYIILWIAVPKAKTVAEKLEMRGEKVNVSNIEKTIREEYDTVKENLKKTRDSETFRNVESFFIRLLKVAGIMIIGFAKIILVLVAISFIIAGIAIITGLIAFIFPKIIVTDLNIHESFSIDTLSSIFNLSNIRNIAINVFILVLIPLLAIIYGIFKIIFKFRAKDKLLGIIAFALWFIALLYLVRLVAIEAGNFSTFESVSHFSTIHDLDSRSISVKIDRDVEYKDQHLRSFSFDNTRYYIKDKEIIGLPKISFERSKTDKYEVEIIKMSGGRNEDEAIKLAGAVNYNFSVDSNTLKLSPYFLINEEQKWRFQKVKATIYIPETDTVVIDENLKKYLVNVKTKSQTPKRLIAGNSWVMSDEGLELVK